MSSAALSSSIRFVCHKHPRAARPGWERNVLSEMRDTRGLRRHEVFASVVQAVLEMAEAGSRERSLLESIQNHLRGAGQIVDAQGRLW